MANIEQDFDEFLFERNEQNPDVPAPKTVNELLKKYDNPEIAAIADRLLHVIFEINDDGTINKMRDSFRELTEQDLYIFDADEDEVYINKIPFNDLILLGRVKGKFLTIDLRPLIMIETDLSKIIKLAMQSRQPSVVYKMMRKNIDLFKIEPHIMTMAVEMDMDDLLVEMIAKGIPIHTEDHRCVYELAEKGKLDILKLIMSRYGFVPDASGVVCKICIKAAIANHVPILKHFLTPTEFAGAPDQMLVFLLNSIRYGGHLDVVKFFVENGVSIRRCNYEPIHQAIRYNRYQILQYFSQIDVSVIGLLTAEQKEQFGFVKIIMMDQDIGTDTICNISHNEILENQTYFQCAGKLHHYKADVWREWQAHKSGWTCPLCSDHVKTVLYVNKKPRFDESKVI